MVLAEQVSLVQVVVLQQDGGRNAVSAMEVAEEQVPPFALA